MGKSGWITVSRERGATVVEFAIIAPLLFVLLFGIIEFGRAMTTYAGVYTAAREGARYAVSVGESPYTSGTPRFLDCPGIRHAAQEKAVLVNLNANDIEVWFERDSAPDLACSTSPIADETQVPPNSRVVVRVTTEFNTPIPVLTTFLKDLQVQAQQTRTIYRGVVEH